MDQVGQIREKIDIVALIQEYIPLKKMGSNFKTTCPFHNEKTPSFVVSPERQIWHCFGCQKGGDAFSFLMEYENLEFIEALRILSKKTGIELTSQFQSGASSQKENIYTLNKLAMEFYHYVLTKHNAGKKALSYLLDQRKLSLPLIETFKLGYAPAVGNALSSYLLEKKGYKKEDLFEAGLAVQRGRVMDFFANRIMFPLTDHRSNIVGFSGRIMDEKNSFGPKYVNTRDTLVYHKGSLFFGLDRAKDEIKKKGKALIAEGEFDVISSFSEGIKNVVAIKGTALTDSQVTLLGRFCKKVALCFDMDSAGQEATKRSLSILEKHGFTTSVVVIKNGKDADEAIKKDPISFKKAIEEDTGIYDFFLSRTLSAYDKKTGEGKKKISDELISIFTNIDNEIVKEHYFRKLSEELDTSYDSISRQAEKMVKKETNTKGQDEKIKRDRKEILEEYLLSLIVQSDNLSEVLSKLHLTKAHFSYDTSAYLKILSELLSFVEAHKPFNRNQFVVMLPKELIETYNICFLFPLPQFANSDHYREEVEKVALELKELIVKDRIKQIGEKIKETEKNGSSDSQPLREELDTLIRLLQKSS